MTSRNETFNSYCDDGDNRGQFKKWLKEVDRLLTNAIGLGVFDLPDRLWRDMFDSEMSASEAAQEAIQNPFG